MMKKFVDEMALIKKRLIKLKLMLINKKEKSSKSEMNN